MAKTVILLFYLLLTPLFTHLLQAAEQKTGLQLAQEPVQEARKTPNVILIMADYMGYADIEPYGAKDIQTPSLNRLERESLLFEGHHTSAPMCIPARLSFSELGL
ncbi:sulfatase-like hydrolase/transferase [Agaribacterium sp. ZY112]|uniref:sulfatase-like hydrolase/transferase n=1 Tax=Agaribacterium sp. ZY112 TaxID=3233574 RepID=UPI003523BB2B